MIVSGYFISQVIIFAVFPFIFALLRNPLRLIIFYVYIGIDLLITDVIMPEMSGRELSDRFLALNENLKTLFISRYTDKTVAHHGVLSKSAAFLQKPFSLQSFGVKIREVLDEDR